MAGFTPIEANAFAAIFLPLAIAVIQQPRWSRAEKLLVTAVISLFFGAVATALEGKLVVGNAHDTAWMLADIAVVLPVALASYTAIWGPKASQIAVFIEQNILNLLPDVKNLTPSEKALARGLVTIDEIRAAIAPAPAQTVAATDVKADVNAPAATTTTGTGA